MQFEQTCPNIRTKMSSRIQATNDHTTFKLVTSSPTGSFVVTCRPEKSVHSVHLYSDHLGTLHALWSYSESTPIDDSSPIALSEKQASL